MSPGRRLLLTCVFPGLVAWIVAACLSWIVRPLPNIHDDFGNLLVADTLLHGRLSNPQPPAWEALQTFHVVMDPTYAAKFPIGIGATLAIGKLLFGSLNAGMWLSAAMASMAVAWMLAGNFSLRWSMTAAMLVALHPIWQLGWSQEYTHGWLSIAGVSLVLGGLLRIRQATVLNNSVHRSAVWNALAIGVGAVLVLFSRPFEGGIVCALLCAPLMVMIVRRGWIATPGFWVAALPGAIVLILGVGLQLSVNRSVTGSYAKLPYQLHEQQYGVAPVVVWQQPHEPGLGHRFAEQVVFHRGWSMDAYRGARSFEGYGQLMQKRVGHLLHHWGMLLALLPMAVMAFPRERRIYGRVLLVALVAIVVINCIPWIAATYVSPLIPLAVVLMCAALRGTRELLLRLTLPDARNGSSSAVDAGLEIRHLASSRIPISARDRWDWILIGGLLFIQMLSLVTGASARSITSSASEPEWCEHRAALAQQLEDQPGKHLVLVRYADGHSVHREWVFNGADPGSEKVVWARWDEALVDRVIQAYPNRTAWLLRVDRRDQGALMRLEY